MAPRSVSPAAGVRPSLCCEDANNARRWRRVSDATRRIATPLYCENRFTQRVHGYKDDYCRSWLSIEAPGVTVMEGVSEEIWTALNSEVSRADEGGEIPEKTRRPAASSGTIPTCEIPGLTRPGIELGSPWWEASRLTAQPYGDGDHSTLKAVEARLGRFVWLIQQRLQARSHKAKMSSGERCSDRGHATDPPRPIHLPCHGGLPILSPTASFHLIAASSPTNRIRLERASKKQSSDAHKTPYDRVKRCREHKKYIKASERVNVDVFTQNKRPCPQHSETQFFSNSSAQFLPKVLSGVQCCTHSAHAAGTSVARAKPGYKLNVLRPLTRKRRCTHDTRAVPPTALLRYKWPMCTLASGAKHSLPRRRYPHAAGPPECTAPRSSESHRGAW
ncbi:hypothetical protein PR048_024864 [Dryococelus australis]|uniref:Uncharacterized protein n=1 Tax=Dryococelus australis TaxID=614101 RepID=A0ABQ9GPS0_9NEOP|nr:hypothetical protein PR048_024864 [Dryococelus australis]